MKDTHHNPENISVAQPEMIKVADLAIGDVIEVEHYSISNKRMMLMTGLVMGVNDYNGMRSIMIKFWDSAREYIGQQFLGSDKEIRLIRREKIENDRDKKTG